MNFLRKNWIWCLIAVGVLGFLFFNFMRDRRRKRNMMIEAKFDRDIKRVNKQKEKDGDGDVIQEIEDEITGLTFDKAKEKIGNRYKMRVCFDPKRKINCEMAYDSKRLTLGVNDEGKINYVSIG